MKKERIKSFDYFRGLAILLVVFNHCYDSKILQEHPIVWNLTTNGTTLFVFISGVFFYLLNHQNSEFIKFNKTKWTNLVIPYLFCSIPILTGIVLFDKYPVEDSLYFDNDFGRIFQYIINGRHLTAYWFIPYAVLLFSMLPIHKWFSEQSMKNQLVLFFVMSSISIFVHRPVDLINPVHSLVYYAPVFWFGIFVSKWKPRIQEFKNLYPLTLLLVLAFAIIQFRYSEINVGTLTKNFFEFGGIDYNYIQKILLLLSFVLLIDKIEPLNLPVMDVLAKYSFPIFFIHIYVWMIVANSGIVELLSGNVNSILSSLLLTALVISISIGLTISIKRILGRKSKYIIGG